MNKQEQRLVESLVELVGKQTKEIVWLKQVFVKVVPKLIQNNIITKKELNWMALKEPQHIEEKQI